MTEEDDACIDVASSGREPRPVFRRRRARRIRRAIPPLRTAITRTRRARRLRASPGASRTPTSGRATRGRWPVTWSRPRRPAASAIMSAAASPRPRPRPCAVVATRGPGAGTRPAATHFRHRVILGWSHGRKYQGGTGAYHTDGPVVPDLVYATTSTLNSLGRREEGEGNEAGNGHEVRSATACGRRAHVDRRGILGGGPVSLLAGAGSGSLSTIAAMAYRDRVESRVDHRRGTVGFHHADDRLHRPGQFHAHHVVGPGRGRRRAGSVLRRDDQGSRTAVACWPGSRPSAAGRVKDTGDGFLLVFDDPAQAVRWAMAVQRSHQDDPIATPLGPLEVKVGLQIGAPLPNPIDPDDYIGQDVNSRRGCAISACGGQIIDLGADGGLDPQRRSSPRSGSTRMASATSKGSAACRSSSCSATAAAGLAQAGRRLADQPAAARLDLRRPSRPAGAGPRAAPARGRRRAQGRGRHGQDHAGPQGRPRRPGRR